MSKDLILEGRIRLTIVDPAPSPSLTAVVTARYDGFITTSTGGSMAYTLPADKQVELKISYVDANNNPATIDGAVTWETSDAEIASCSPVTDDPLEDNSHVVLVPGSKVGNCQITAKADADLGSGVRELVTPFDVTVVGGEAIAGTIEPVGEATDKPQQTQGQRRRGA